MQTFANRMHTSLTTIGRYETSNPPPRGKVLRRFYLLAKKHGHPSAKVFASTIEAEETHEYNRKRMGEICEPSNIAEAVERLTDAIWDLQSMEKMWHIEPPTPAGIEEVKETLLKMADLLCLEGRKDITGEKK
jgi:hypothetical protein